MRPDGFTACSSCAVVKKLCHQMKDLQEEVSRLSSIRDERKAVEWLFSKQLQLQELKLPAVEERQAEPVPVRVCDIPALREKEHPRFIAARG